MKRSGKTYLLLAIGVITASAAAVQSFAIVNQRRAPARSVAFGMPFGGVAKASLGSALQAARIAKNPQSVPAKAEIQLAREGFASEPLAMPALAILIQSAEAEGRAAQARKLLVRAGELSRRDNLINAMLIDDAMKKNDPSRAVLLLGRAMTVNYKVRDIYVGRMAAATVRPGALEALPPLLGRNPDWAKEYWATIAGNSALMPNGAKVRLQIARTPWNLNKPNDTDFRLIKELANFDPATAFGLSQALGSPNSSTGEILTSPNFDREPQFVPFDWELLQSGDIGADIEPKAGRLVLSSLPAASGVAARQMVRIAGSGRYRVQWKISGLSAGTDASLKFRLSCADRAKGVAPIAPAILAQGSGSAVVDIGTSACGWYWATLELDTSLSPAGVDVEVRQLSLRRETARAVASKTAQSQF